MDAASTASRAVTKEREVEAEVPLAMDLVTDGTRCLPLLPMAVESTELCMEARDKAR